MKLKIVIVMENAAFELEGQNAEAARILESLATDMRSGNCLGDPGDHETLMDINGNRVGEAKVTR
jgi:O-succinylbenzoate synthase